MYRNSKMVRPISKEIYYGLTRSTCPECLKIIDAQIIVRDNKVYFDKFCPDHGKSRILVSSDIQWYDFCRNYQKANSVPLKIDKKAQRGCPHDCGICGQHRQHTGIVMFGVTNVCNINCPICCVHNEDNWSLTYENAKKLIDTVTEREGKLEILSISGGEPTLHPQIIDIIKYAKKNNVVRCCISSNGIRIANDPEFAQQLAEAGAFVNLQFDGFRPETYKIIRGDAAMYDIKMKAIENLKKYNVKTVLIPTIVEGLNDDEIGKIFDFAIKEKFISSIHIQPLTHIGEGGENFKFDPLNHVTVPDILTNIEKYFNYKIKRTDFVPEPCECFLTSYILKLENQEPIPLQRLINMSPYADKLQNNMGLTKEDISNFTKTVVKNLFFSNPEGQKNSLLSKAKYIKPLIKLGLEINKIKMKYKDRAEEEVVKLLEDKVLLVNFHAMMDKYTFDQKRLMQCVHQWITPDGKIYPFCSYGLFHSVNAKESIFSNMDPNTKVLAEETKNICNKFKL